ncbi:hypothetical protein BaRGS_00022555 [Batillaria attramentaria]|uniref:WD repeat-containing protein 91 n=1 Tax=Batillaria attramentaria TaxID=370345 RepID=A0ABD0KH58_9CAEN
MATACERLDSLVKDYLLFRGFTATAKTFDHELKQDKDRGLRADKILEQLLAYIGTYDLQHLRENWAYLNHRFFSRLEQRYASSVRKLEISLLKLYVVNAQQNNRQDRVRDFFERMGPELQNQQEFRDWFAFPFLSSPAENSTFSLETEVVNEKQKPARRFAINLSTPLLKRRQEPRPEKSKASVSRAGALPVSQPSNQSSNNSSTRVSTQISQPRPSRPSFTTSTGTSAAKASAATSTVQPAVATAGTFSTSGVPVGQKSITSRRVSDTSQPSGVSGYQQQGTDRSVVAGVRGKVARELTSFPPYTSPQSEKTDLVPATVASSGGDVGKPDLITDQSSSAGDANNSSCPPEQGDAGEHDTASVSAQQAEPLECAVVEKLQELKAGEQCPFLLLSEDDYLEHQSAVCYSRFSSTGQHIASLDADGVVKVWTWSPQPCTTATVMSRAPFLSLDWASKSDRWLLLGNKSGQIRLFDTREIKTFREASVEAPYARVVYLSTCPATMMFASCLAAAGSAADAGGCLALWDLRTMKLEKTITTDPVPVASTCCVHNMTGKQLLSGGADGWIRLYDVGQQQCVMKWPAHRGPVSALHFGSQESSCFSMGTDGKLCEWSLTRNGHPLRQIVMTAGISTQETGACPAASTIPQGQPFCLNKDKTYILASTTSQGIICKVRESSDQPTLPRIMDLSRHNDCVTTVDWSPSVETPVCLTGARDGCLKVFTLLSQ